MYKMPREDRIASQKTLRRMSNMIIDSALRSQENLDVKVSCQFEGQDKDLRIDIVICKEDRYLCLSLYSFYSDKKNTKIVEMILSLIKDSSKFEEISLEAQAV